MKHSILAFFAVSIFALAGCQGITPEVVIPAVDPLPAVDGKLVIEFTDAKIEANPTITISPDDAVAVSLNIKKSPDGGKPRKLVVYIADQPNVRGTLFLDNIKLKNIDEQTQSIEYSLPPSVTSGQRIFYFEVVDNNEKRTRKTLIVNISTTPQTSIWSNITLGAQSNATASRFASATGDLYKVCDLDSNINFVDITYAAIGSPSAKPTLLSNPRRGALALSTTVPTTNTDCAGSSTGGGSTTYFGTAPTTFDFATVTDDILKGLTIATTAQDIVIEQGKIYTFLSIRNGKDGKSISRKGVIKINTIVNTSSASGVAFAGGTVNFDVKVQK